MYYYINTKLGPRIKNDEIMVFDNTTTAREHVIKYCNLSDDKLEIIPFDKSTVLQNLSINLALLDYLRGKKAIMITP